VNAHTIKSPALASQLRSSYPRTFADRLRLYRFSGNYPPPFNHVLSKHFHSNSYKEACGIHTLKL